MLSNNDGFSGPRCDITMLISDGGRLGDCIDVLVDGLVTKLVILFCWLLTFDTYLDSSLLITI